MTTHGSRLPARAGNRVRGRIAGIGPLDREVARASEKRGRRDADRIVTIATSHVEYSTENRHYAHVTVTAETVKPVVVEECLRFAVREGGRTVGAGVVTGIIA